MILRLRSRDGLERVTVDGAATTAADLFAAVAKQLNVPLAGLKLSKDAALLSRGGGAGGDDDDISGGAELLPSGAKVPLAALGLAHGDVVYMDCGVERTVDSGVPKPAFVQRPFGAATTAAEIAARQRRIERQGAGKVESVSFDRDAANAFQSYAQSALGFSIKRGGLLYGTVDDAGHVRVEAVYEPPQSGGAEALALERGGAGEAQADFLAELFGLQKVGWIFAQSNAERDFIVSADELVDMALVQGELGPRSVTVVVSFDPNEQGGHVHFEAFQCSEQAVQLAADGWFKRPSAGAGAAAAGGGGGDGGGKKGSGGGGGGATGVLEMVNPQFPDMKEPVIVAGKDASQVDTDWFLVPLKILDHSGPFAGSRFPVENRLIPQTKSDLAAALRPARASSAGPRAYERALCDFHLLLWLSRQPQLEPADVLAVAEAARGAAGGGSGGGSGGGGAAANGGGSSSGTGAPLAEGYRFIIDALAGLG